MGRETRDTMGKLVFPSKLQEWCERAADTSSMDPKESEEDPRREVWRQALNAQHAHERGRRMLIESVAESLATGIEVVRDEKTAAVSIRLSPGLADLAETLAAESDLHGWLRRALAEAIAASCLVPPEV